MENNTIGPDGKNEEKIAVYFNGKNSLSLYNVNFYEKITEIVKNANDFWGFAHTPALLLQNERKTEKRKEYYDILMKKIKRKEISVEYFFPLQTTEEKINEIIKEAEKNYGKEAGIKKLGAIKDNWNKITNLPGFDVRYLLNTDLFPPGFAIGYDKKENLFFVGYITKKEKEEIEKIKTEKEINEYIKGIVQSRKDFFSERFQTASKDLNRVIEEIENKNILNNNNTDHPPSTI